MQEYIPENFEKIWVCGSPDFNREIPKAIIGARLDHEKIILL